MKPITTALCLALALTTPATAQHATSPSRAYARALAAVTHDPPRDARHPARNRQLLIDSHGAKMNALFFLAAGVLVAARCAQLGGRSPRQRRRSRSL